MVSHMVIKHAPYSIISFQKFVGSDSDDTDEEDSDDTEEREKFVVEHPLSEESGGCDQFLEKERSRAIFNKATFIAEN
jgi:hypothetical protein